MWGRPGLIAVSAGSALGEKLPVSAIMVFGSFSIVDICLRGVSTLRMFHLPGRCFNSYVFVLRVVFIASFFLLRDRKSRFFALND